MTSSRSVAALVAEASGQLAGAGLPGPAQQARTLLAFVLAVEPSRLVLVESVDAEPATRFRELVRARVTGHPLQHLTGRAHFRHTSVEVGPGVFVPRPETEVMTGWAVDRLRSVIGSGRTPLVVELCTGSGVIAKAINQEVPGCEIFAVEVSEQAYGFAERNLAGTGVSVQLGDMADAFTELDTTVDLVISNPPYIPWEAWESVPAEVRDHDPQVALFSGSDGLDALRVVARVAARLLHPGGVVCAEHAEVQHDSAPQVFVRAATFTHVRDHVDLAGRPRFVTATRV